MAPNASPMAQEGHEDRDPHPLFGVFPIATLVGGLACVTRVWLEREAALERGLGDLGARIQVQASVANWVEVLVEALIAGFVSSLVLTYAVTRRDLAPRAVALVVTLVAIGAFVMAFPSEIPGPSVVSIGASLGLVLFAYGLARLPFSGALALALGLSVGIGGPAYVAQWIRRTMPGMPVRDVVVDLVSMPGSWEVVEERDDAPVSAAVITPCVDQRTDTGDKPSIAMTPPAAVQFEVPVMADGTRFEVAAGLDGSLLRASPGGADVVYRVRVNGEVAWETTYEHRPVPSGRTFDTTGQQWRHAEQDGERGLLMQAGDVVRLETEWGAMVPAEGAQPKIRVGFGSPALVRKASIPREVAVPDAPNIVFIVMDTQRRDRMGCYGYERDTTPNIDALSERGLRFDDAYTTSSWTWPSTASLLTGLPPDAHGVRGPTACTLSQKLDTLAEALQLRGYTTAAFVGNPIVEPDRYFDQGFEEFHVQKDSIDVAFRMSDEVVPPALDWLELHAPLRFFLYLHLVDPHTPHRPDAGEMERLEMADRPADWPDRGLDAFSHGGDPNVATLAYANDLYDASVATGDLWVGRVLEKIEELGLTESTVICFTSDHGEELFEHGRTGHGHAVWSDLVRAPLIFAGPGIPQDVRLGAVSNRYVPTTLARIAGADLQPFGLPVDLIEDECPDQAIYSTTKGVWGTGRYQRVYGLRRGTELTHWRQSDVEPSKVAAGDMRRFDLRTDPGELDDLTRSQGLDVRGSVGQIAEFIREGEEAKPPLVLGVGSGGRNALREIGYGDGSRDDER